MRRRLASRSYPRLLVLLIVVLSGLAAFLVSAGTLQLGVTQMGLRYFGAMLVGYLTFLLLLRVWIAYERRDWHIEGDLPDVGSSEDQGTRVVRSLVVAGVAEADPLEAGMARPEDPTSALISISTSCG
jgi:hypothetical protein